MPQQGEINHISGGTTLTEIRLPADFPPWLTASQLIQFLHFEMKPYEDKPADIQVAINYALSCTPDKGGFILVASHKQTLQGAVVILNTGMSGFIPEHILVFICVASNARGCGLGTRIVREALARCAGEVKLHVEYENPAKRLYERLGFVSKYAEMRINPEVDHEPRHR